MEVGSNCLYFHINLIKQEIFYVGIGELDRPYEITGRNKWWHNEANKYNYDIIIVHKNLTWKEACELEVKYIKQIGRRKFNEGPLVNITAGGEGFRGKHTPETKLKMSIASKGHKRNIGRVLSQETKDKIGKANSKPKSFIVKEKYKHSEETKKKIALALKGKVPWNKGIIKLKEPKIKLGRINFKHTEEFKIRMSLLRKGKIRGPYKKSNKHN